MVTFAKGPGFMPHWLCFHCELATTGIRTVPAGGNSDFWSQLLNRYAKLTSPDAVGLVPGAEPGASPHAGCCSTTFSYNHMQSHIHCIRIIGSCSHAYGTHKDLLLSPRSRARALFQDWLHKVTQIRHVRNIVCPHSMLTITDCHPMHSCQHENHCNT